VFFNEVDISTQYCVHRFLLSSFATWGLSIQLPNVSGVGRAAVCASLPTDG